jgi:hypothetical protein
MLLVLDMDDEVGDVDELTVLWMGLPPMPPILAILPLLLLLLNEDGPGGAATT